MNSAILKNISSYYGLFSISVPNILLTILLLLVNFYTDAQEVLLNNNEVYLAKTPKVVKIKPKADNEFQLFADYYQGNEHAGGVIVIHDCDNDRKPYNLLAKTIAEQDLHTLLVDLRGYGESVSQLYSREILKDKSTDIVNFQSEMVFITAHWGDDLLAAYNFLINNIDKTKGVAVVASGCSTAYAVTLAEKVQLSAMVMITPKMNYNDKDRYKNLIDIPSYFIASANQLSSYQIAQELFAWSGDKHSKMQVFKGNDDSYQVINRQKLLSNDIAFWLTSNFH